MASTNYSEAEVVEKTGLSVDEMQFLSSTPHFKAKTVGEEVKAYSEDQVRGLMWISNMVAMTTKVALAGLV